MLKTNLIHTLLMRLSPSSKTPVKTRPAPLIGNLSNMYWGIGELVSRRVSESGWGKSVVKDFSDFIQSRYTGIKGFSPQNIWRMKQFYETYRDNEKLSPLVREISWTNNIENSVALWQ